VSKDEHRFTFPPRGIFRILRQLSKTDNVLKKKIIEFAKELYRNIDIDGSEFKDWATDLPGESFGDILSEWGKSSDTNAKKEMKTFILPVQQAVILVRGLETLKSRHSPHTSY